MYSAIAELRTRLTDNDLPSAEWARRVTDRLEILAGPILTRERQVAAPIATALRVLPLCLAAEADALQAADLGNKFRRIAAAITGLERRHNGDDPAVEMIVLALNSTTNDSRRNHFSAGGRC